MFSLQYLIIKILQVILSRRPKLQICATVQYNIILCLSNKRKVYTLYRVKITPVYERSRGYVGGTSM